MQYDIYTIRIYKQLGDVPNPDIDEFLTETSVNGVNNNNVEFDTTIHVPFGDHTIYAIVEDRVGNKSIHSNVVSFVVQDEQ